MQPRAQEVVRLPCQAGGEIEAYLSWQEHPADWAVVFVHGLGSVRGGEKSRAVEAACARRGWTFAACDFRGHGNSTGTMLDLRGSAVLDDLETLRAHLTERGIQQLCLVGSSMGGWAAAWFTLRRPEAVAACALVAPAFRFPTGIWSRLSEEQRQEWRRTGRLRVRNEWLDTEIGIGFVEEAEQFPFERLVSGWAKPLMIFHGLGDEVVLATQSIEFLQRAAFADIELRLYKAGDHRLAAFKDDIAEAACAFFGSRIQARP